MSASPESPEDLGSRANAQTTNGASASTASPWEAFVTTAPPDWYRVEPPARTWLLRDARADSEGVLPRGTVGLLVAEGGAGKTMLLSQLAIAVSTGTPWLGALDVATPGRVLLALGEEDRDEVRRRLYRAARASCATMPPEHDIVTMSLRGADCSLIRRDKNNNPRSTPFAHWLLGYIEQHGPWALVVVDPLSRFAGLDAETDNASGTRYIEMLEAIAQIGPTVLGSHHTNKPSRGEGTVQTHAARGSTSLTDGARWVSTLSHQTCDGDDVITLAFAKSNVSRKCAPIELRWRDSALVPLDDVERERVEAVRSGAPERTRKRKERQVERETSLDELERSQAERRQRRQSAREDETRQRDAEDDEAAREVMAAHPDATVRELDALVRRRRACGQPRAHAAVTRVRREVPHGD